MGSEIGRKGLQSHVMGSEIGGEVLQGQVMGSEIGGEGLQGHVMGSEIGREGPEEVPESVRRSRKCFVWGTAADQGSM